MIVLQILFHLLKGIKEISGIIFVKKTPEILFPTTRKAMAEKFLEGLNCLLCFLVNFWNQLMQLIDKM